MTCQLFFALLFFVAIHQACVYQNGYTYCCCYGGSVNVIDEDCSCGGSFSSVSTLQSLNDLKYNSIEPLPSFNSFSPSSLVNNVTELHAKVHFAQRRGFLQSLHPQPELQESSTLAQPIHTKSKSMQEVALFSINASSQLPRNTL